jgi:hypothetical protein
VSSVRQPVSKTWTCRACACACLCHACVMPCHAGACWCMPGAFKLSLRFQEGDGSAAARQSLLPPARRVAQVSSKDELDS